MKCVDGDLGGGFVGLWDMELFMAELNERIEG